MSSQSTPTRPELSHEQEQEIQDVFDALGLSSELDREVILGLCKKKFSIIEPSKDPEVEIVSTSTPFGREQQNAQLDRAT